MKKNNITLIGMPGAGKSTVGVLLAKRLGYSFVDVDIVIQEQEKRLLKEIIADEGMDGFLEVENRVNAGLDVERSVIAPGGSVIYGKEAMEHLKDIGVVVYLKLSYRALERRLGDLVDRGVALKEGMTLRDLYNERKVYYEKYADITIDEAGKTVGRIVDELRAIMEARISEEYESIGHCGETLRRPGYRPGFKMHEKWKRVYRGRPLCGHLGPGPPGGAGGSGGLRSKIQGVENGGSAHDAGAL